MILFLVAVTLVALGVILMVAAVILFLLSRRGGGEAGAAGVIIIGPIPILVASDKDTAKLAVLLTVASLAIFALFILVTWGARP